MINVTQGGWNWDVLDSPGECANPDVWHAPSDRISQLLGPDGEPLRVPYPRAKMGFDLSQRKDRA